MEAFITQCIAFLLLFLLQPVNAFDAGDAAALVIGLVIGIRGDPDRGRYENQRGRGRGQQERGRRGHPSGLTGKELGLWYAARGKERKKEHERKQRPVVHFTDHHERMVESVLDLGSDGNNEVNQSVGAAQFVGNLEPDEVYFDQASVTHSCHADEQVSRGSLQPTTCSLANDSDLNLRLKERLDSMRGSSKEYQTMLEFRKKLPSYGMKDELVAAIKSNQVLVISGETGCGKTTQVAQFILDDAIDNNRASQCHIICTQPRRISAISVAQRVAKERVEQCGSGRSIGFQIRLESQLPRSHASILYCTTGILLRRLISDPLLRDVSHVILDEIHERDLFSDFLLIIIKDLLPLRPDLKLVLMSATLNSEMFSQYYHCCPKINIPGFTFPVQEYYLEDIFEKLRYSPSLNRSAGASRPPPRWVKHTRRFREQEQKNQDDRRNFEDYLHNLSKSMAYSAQTIEAISQANTDQDNIDFRLIESLIRHICLSMEAGAILVFLPGWDDISKLHDMLKSNPVFGSSNYLIIPLHSLMPTTFQQQVFDRPAEGVRKIIIATNIAETSITIDDVVFVINSGKTKEKTYDTELNISCLKPVWISQASSRQRRGRAGRVQAGYCFHMFTKYQAEILAEYQDPEILRTPLEELCLQIKILSLGRVEPFLSKALQPPSSSSLRNAIRSLTELNALDSNEHLTPLGYHLARLPVDPKVGKMILFGAMFSCLDPVLTVASSLGFKDPFIIPLHKQKEADNVRERFSKASYSDHVMLVNAFSEWEKSRQRREENDWCWRNFLSRNTLNMIKNMKSQFARLLHEIGFLSSPDCCDKEANIHSDNTKLFKAVICAGLYPNVAKVIPRHAAKRPPKLETKQDGKVAIHPKSVNSEVRTFESQWIIYHLKMRTSKIYLFDTTMISPLPLLFFGGKISTTREDFQNIIKVDDWIKFQASNRIAKLVKELRVKLDDWLEQKIANPNLKIIAGSSSDRSEEVLLSAIIDLITAEEIKHYSLMDCNDKVFPKPSGMKEPRFLKRKLQVPKVKCHTRCTGQSVPTRTLMDLGRIVRDINRICVIPLSVQNQRISAVNVQRNNKKTGV
eukprot:gene15883-17483_t